MSTIPQATAAIQAAVDALNPLLASVAAQIAALDAALLARHDAITAEFRAAGVPAPALASHTGGYERTLCQAYLTPAAEPLLRFLNPAHLRIEPFTLAEFTERLATVEAATQATLARAAGGAQ